MHDFEDLGQELFLRHPSKEKTLQSNVVADELPSPVFVHVFLFVAGEVYVVETEVFGGEFRVPTVSVLVGWHFNQPRKIFSKDYVAIHDDSSLLMQDLQEG